MKISNDSLINSNTMAQGKHQTGTHVTHEVVNNTKPASNNNSQNK